MTYPEALAFLDTFLNYEQITAYPYPGAFSLDRMERLLEGLGNPHRGYPVLHVAGTKGKGSTCAFAASILRVAGAKTGLYTSPHLFSFRERIQVDGVMISEEDLAAAAERLQPLAGKDLTYFEVVTACAFLHFQKEGVGAAVIEVGMGGRLDATNLVAPEVTAITPVSLDHMPKLGNTLGLIAREKAGILKRGVPAVIGPQLPEALKVLLETAAAVGAEPHLLEGEVGIRAEEVGPARSQATFKTPERTYKSLTIPLLGRHQLANAATAIRMTELMARRRPEIEVNDEAVWKGISSTRWPGRCQVIPGDPPVLLDGAQNAESARALKTAAQELFPSRKVAMIIGVSREKDLEGMAGAWGPWARRIFLTEAPVPRAEPIRRLQEIFSEFHFFPMESGGMKQMLNRARQEAGSAGLVVVSGSLFVVAEGLRCLEAAPPLPGKEETGSQKSG